MPIAIATAKEQLVRINEILHEPHLLIGGLAVEHYYKGRHSQDIDLVCDSKTARELLRLYPSSEWSIEERNNDEYRPNYQIANNIHPDLLIIFGPKLSERDPYRYIDWNALHTGAKPFEYKGKILKNVLIPSAASLAFTKLIAAVDRKATSRPKSAQDFEDFINLTNCKTFSVNDFVFLFKRAKVNSEFGLEVATTIIEYQETWKQSNIMFLFDVLTHGKVPGQPGPRYLVEINRTGDNYGIHGDFPIENMFVHTNKETERDLLERIAAAQKEIIAFGLTRNFYVDKMPELLIEKSNQVDIKIFLMDPSCGSRVDRYRIEPAEAAFEDPVRFNRMIVEKYKTILSARGRKKKNKGSLRFPLFICNRKN
jgi:hypothetical protein